MKTNPFYALSASAMLLGCWLLSEALHPQAGQLGGLLLLMTVLQLYEGLLVGLGSFLVRTGRTPRHGVTVLVIESVFLMDAPLLAVECVTVNARVGTGVALALAGLAAAKLARVRRAAPSLLTLRAAALLGAQAAFVLVAPVLAARLASARVLGPIALYGFWWATLALPLARDSLRGETRPEGTSRPRAAWTWVPAAMVLLHLWAIGYVHTIDFRPAFLAPLLLGLVATSRREQVLRQVALPGCAILVSLGQGSSLGVHLFGADQAFSPLRLSLLGVAAAWGYLAWRDRERWLAVLAASSGAAGLLGSSASGLSSLVGRTLRWVGSHLPADAFGWGVLAVVAAFVLLAAGARRSLAPEPGGPPSGPRRRTDDARRRWRERAAVALALAVFALAAMAAAFEAFPLGHPSLHGPAGLASGAAIAAFVMALRARGRAAREAEDAPARQLAGLAMAASAVGFLLALTALNAAGPCVSCSEARVIGEIQTAVASSRTPGPSGRAVRGPIEKHGYRLTLRPGPVPGAFAWVAVPKEPGTSGVRGFCGDSGGVLCFTADGRAPRVRPDGSCDLATCGVLE